MTAVVVTYLLAEPNLALGRYIPYNIALFVGLGITLLFTGFYVYKLITGGKHKDGLLS